MVGVRSLRYDEVHQGRSSLDHPCGRIRSGLVSERASTPRARPAAGCGDDLPGWQTRASRRPNVAGVRFGGTVRCGRLSVSHCAARASSGGAARGLLHRPVTRETSSRSMASSSSRTCRRRPSHPQGVMAIGARILTKPAHRRPHCPVAPTRSTRPTTPVHR